MFVRNGGYGSVLLALSHGVPLLVAGVREGKSDVNAHVDFFGAGIDLRTERPKPERIRVGVQRRGPRQPGGQRGRRFQG